MVVLEKTTLESPVDCKEIKPANPKSVVNIHWKNWCWSWSSSTLATWCKELTHWKRPWCWESLKAGGDGDNRAWDDWVASPTQCTWVWDPEGQGSLACCSPWGCRESDMTEWLNWTELNPFNLCNSPVRLLLYYSRFMLRKLGTKLKSCFQSYRFKHRFEVRTA